MNKILINNRNIDEVDGLEIKDNEITFIYPGDYFVEYVNDGNYKFTFVMNCDVNLIESSFNKEINSNNRYIVNGSRVNITKFYDNKSVNEKLNIDLCLPGSQVSYKFANICKENEYYEININHKVENTISDINNKSVALKNSKLKYVINSNVKKEAIKSVLNQNTRIITMGDADASISPNMFIDLDDVEAKHGSIIGKFKEEDIFYLMSKGISYNNALKLLIKGYLLSNILVNNEIRKKIMDIIEIYWR